MSDYIAVRTGIFCSNYPHIIQRGLTGCLSYSIGHPKASNRGISKFEHPTSFFILILNLFINGRIRDAIGEFLKFIAMKKTVCLLIASLVIGGVSFAQTKTTKELRKERESITKMSKAALNDKATKAARKEAKGLKKDGWVVSPGSLPLDKQLDKSYLMQYEYDENMFPKYIMGEAMSIGENYDAAKMQALELAKQNLAGQIQTEVTALVENTVANKQLAQEEAASVTQSIMAAKNLISQSIGRVIPVVECYRTKSNKNKEVLVRIAYNSKMAMDATKKAIREDLEKRGDDLHKKLDKALGW